MNASPTLPLVPHGQPQWSCTYPKTGSDRTFLGLRVVSCKSESRDIEFVVLISEPYWCRMYCSVPIVTAIGPLIKTQEVTETLHCVTPYSNNTT